MPAIKTIVLSSNALHADNVVRLLETVPRLTFDVFPIYDPARLVEKVKASHNLVIIDPNAGLDDRILTNMRSMFDGDIVVLGKKLRGERVRGVTYIDTFTMLPNTIQDLYETAGEG